jgi:hypothetical protein
MPQRAKIRPALTEPIFGSTKSRSRTRAVRAHAGGLGEDLRQLDLARRQIPLQLRSRRADLVRLLEGTQALFARSARNAHSCLSAGHAAILGAARGGWPTGTRQPVGTSARLHARSRRRREPEQARGVRFRLQVHEFADWNGLYAPDRHACLSL